MTKAKLFGMEKLMTQVGDFRSKLMIGHGLVATTTVSLVADDRVF